MPQYNGSNPIFDFNSVDGSIYQHQQYQFDHEFYPRHWLSSGPPTVVPPAPSPNNTVQTHWTALPRHVVQERNPLRQRKAVSHNSNLDTRLQSARQSLPHLDTRQSPANQPNPEPILNPIALFYHQNEGPWNAFGGMRNPQEGTAQNNFLHTQVNYGKHHRGPCSDVGSNVPASDSGYYTHQTLSVLSNEPGRVQQELPAGLLDQTKNLNVDRSPTGSQVMLRRTSDQISVLSHHSSRSGGHKQLFPCREPGCSEFSKCASEQKKHMLKHKKNFVCGETGCKRSGKGFSTINDLDRHRKSVHKINTTKSISYQCAASACANKDKIWPRLDNFKQHVERMHKEDDMCELIKLSECHLQEAPEAQQPLSVDPALLAGIGDLNHSLIATSAYGLAYHSPMSFNTTSMSSVSEVSPSTTPFNLSVSQLGAPPSMGDAANTRRQDSAALSRTVSSTSADRLRSTKALPSVVASTLTSMRGQSNNCESTPKLQLSTAPQTKAEQQIQALEKFSKANINIDEIMQLVLGAQQQQNSSSRGEHADIERRQTLQAIADLLKPKPKPMRLQKRGLNQGSTPGTRQCDYEGCNVFGRPCDLNKHKKRHEKPYGCTYPKCPKIFGAKSDWKRHENSQHFQLEAFRCDLANKAGKKCGQHCYRPMQFQKHIEEKHKITPGTQVKVHLQRCRIGKNCQDQFWCGFCGKIITLASKRNAAWDERFDHIARHFEREQKRIDTWLCVEENKTKKQLHDDMDRRNFADEDVGENEADHGLKGDDELVSQMDRSSAETYQPPTHDDSRKRTIVSNPSRAQPPVEKPNPTILWSCCKCHDGPFTYSVHLSCAECSNAFCDRCPRFYADDNEF